MPLLSRKRLILAKTEANYGVSAAPAGTDAILVRNLDITPLESDIVSRDLIRPYLGNSEQLLANPRVRVTCEVELAGSGAAGTGPRYGPLLLSCGMAATTVASTSVTYAPVSSSFISCTIAYNIDGVQHLLTGCRGTFTLSCQLGQIPVLQFEMTGIYNTPTDTAQPSVTYGNQVTPLLFREGNTSGFSFLGYSGCLMSVDFNMANSIVYRELIGCTKEVLITDRRPAGTVMIEAPTIAQKNYFTDALNSTTGSLAFTHGTSAGNRVVFTAAQANLTQPTYSDSDGIHMLSLPYVATPTTAGNNEVSLAFT
jgi:hypothetical protein